MCFYSNYYGGLGYGCGCLGCGCGCGYGGYGYSCCHPSCCGRFWPYGLYHRYHRHLDHAKTLPS
ncbi:keratin-associated protein 20-2-like [Kogia breviceps]|uniref:keratin-associated protein 20-2-like n=1 Tax=Kogia breviceps TaxID=27615 RepID=UPI002795F8CE|nr:keratin-associated protein 20-2-like [Kogia breviceps]